MTATIRRVTICAVSAALLAGCAGPQLQFTAGTRSLPVEESFVLPAPGTVAALTLVEKRYSNAIQQDLFLATSGTTPGQNYMRIQLYGTSTDVPFRDNGLGFRSITAARVASEMRQELPGVRMARSPYYVQNNYGAFGYAFGRSGASDLCLYAWQQIRAPTGTVSPLANYGAIQVRLRMCQAGATETQLLSAMYGYTINVTVGTDGWNPYGEPQGVPTTLGRPGNPIYPKAPEASVITPIVRPVPVSRPAAVRPITRRRVVQAREPVETVMTPSTTVIVPSPGARTTAPMSRSSAIPSPGCALDVQGEKPIGCQ